MDSNQGSAPASAGDGSKINVLNDWAHNYPQRRATHVARLAAEEIRQALDRAEQADRKFAALYGEEGETVAEPLTIGPVRVHELKRCGVYALKFDEQLSSNQLENIFRSLEPWKNNYGMDFLILPGGVDIVPDPSSVNNNPAIDSSWFLNHANDIADAVGSALRRGHRLHIDIEDAAHPKVGSA